MPLILIVSISASALAGDSKAEAQKAIQSQFAKLSKAFAAKDAKGFESVFAPEFKAKAPGRNGFLKREDVFKEFEGQMRAMDGVVWTQKIKKFDLQKGVAAVQFESEMKAKVKGNDGKPHDFHLTSKSKNEWVKIKGTWLDRYSETEELKIWIDGKLQSGG